MGTSPEPSGSPLHDWLWRLFSVVAGLAVVFATAWPSDVGGLPGGLFRLLGVIVLFTIVFSYIASMGSE